VISFLMLMTAWGQEDAYDAELEQQAEMNFSTVMSRNSAPAAARPRAMNGSGYVAANVEVSGGEGTAGPEVVVDLSRYEALADAELPLTHTGPLVVLGSSRYSGELVDGALSLTLELTATLSGDGLWKTVPLVGEGIVVVSATEGGAALPMSRDSGYHVWITDEVGEVDLTLELLVPPSGPRGALEFDMLVPRTPITAVDIDFPAEDLSPRLRGAVREEITPRLGGTTLTADLAPTSRLHLVGFHDLGAEESEREARLYAESLNLLSVQEGRLEQFVVIRYNILYAGAQRFDVDIPAGMTVVSAEGEGAFRYQLEGNDDGTTRLVGETAYPIRSRYEISLRLAGALDGETVEIALPRAVGVARETGWMGVEVVGNLQLTETSREEAVAVEVQQLPWEMLDSAVSPILKAYRYHSQDARITLSGEAFAEQELVSGSIDLLEADTVISSEGAALTDLRIHLRNRLRHSLRLELPEGASVRQAMLDDTAVQPSRTPDGALLLPLRRSEDVREGFVVEVVYEHPVPLPGLIGPVDLTLPKMDVPISAVDWSLHLPGNRVYSKLEGDVEAQSFAGMARWFSPPVAGGGLSGTRASSQISLPTGGTELTHRRYWIGEGAPVTVSMWSAGRAVVAPGRALLSLLSLVVMVGALLRPLMTHRLKLVGLGAVGLWLLLGMKGVLGAGVLALVLGGELRTGLVDAARAQSSVLRLPEDNGAAAWGGRLMRLGVAVFLGLLVFTGGVQLIGLLGHPL
jgi:hypothetical protein